MPAAADDQATDSAWLDALAEILERSHLFQPDELAPAVAAAMGRVGLAVKIYLVDDEQRALWPLHLPGDRDVAPISVDTTIPGRAFRLVRPISAGNVWWLPMVDGSDRLGVVSFMASQPAEEVPQWLIRRYAMVAGLVGHLVTVSAPKGDYLLQIRRAQPMPVGAELLSHMLPPLTSSCERLVISAILEPCHDIAGDGFDYAIDGATAHISILDAVGHGLTAAVACTLALAALRAARRGRHGLYEQARAADAVLAEHFSDATFVTAVLAELDLDTGRLRYINAGHPQPLVLRANKVVRHLTEGRRLPLGLDDAAVIVGEEMLQRSDRLLLYSDGVVEARGGGGEMFGVQRLVQLAQRHAADKLSAPETLRRLARAVTGYSDAALTDDTTLVLAEWSPAAATRTVP
jgi:hypothetical protein